MLRVSRSPLEGACSHHAVRSARLPEWRRREPRVRRFECFGGTLATTCLETTARMRITRFVCWRLTLRQARLAGVGYLISCATASEASFS